MGYKRRIKKIVREATEDSYRADADYLQMLYRQREITPITEETAELRELIADEISEVEWKFQTYLRHERV